MVSKEHVLDMYLRKLVAFDKLFDNRGRDFFKTTKEAIDSLALAAGKKPMPTGQGGVMLVENEQLAELSQKHKNLLTAILAVTSNGSKAEINLTEAIVIYSVIINEMQDEHTKKIESGEFTEGSKEEKKWLKSWNGGGRIAARLELVEGNDKHTVTKFTPDRAVNIANSLRKLIELYDFSNPNQFKKTLKKEVPQNAEGIKVGAQNIFGRKIGAFMMNLLGDASVITQDLHVVESLDRVFRPVNGYSVNISALRELMKSQMDMSESEIAKVEESWLYESKENADGTSFVLLQGLSRIKIVSIEQEIPFRILNVEPIETIVDDSSNGLREKIIYQLERNLTLGGDVTKEMLDFLAPIEDNTSFVDLAAYSLCKQSLRKQALLEVRNLGKRAQMLIDDLIWENDRLDLINKALGGKDEESNFN